MVAISDAIPTLSTDGGGGLAGGFISGDMASQIVAQSQSFGSIDIGAVNSALSNLGGQDAAFAGAVQSEISAGLTPVEQGQLAAEADIVVTAQSRPVSDAEIAGYDQANQERPTETVAFANTQQLDVAEGYFHAQQALTGPMANDQQIQSDFAAYRAELEGREQVANAIADRASLDVVKSVIPPLETATAMYRVGVNGEYNLENGIAIAGAAAGSIGGIAAKAVGSARIAGSTIEGIKTADGVLFNGITGPGPLGPHIAATFRGGSYTEVVTTETTSLYRVYGGRADELGAYWTKTPPSGPVQSVIDSALDPAWGNTATNVVRIDVPAGATIYQGAAAAQGGLAGGGDQVFIKNVDAAWVVK